MTDTQHLISTARAQLDSISTDIERHFDALASHLRDWIPYDRATHSISLAPARPIPPPTYLQRVERWVGRHKALTAAVLAFVVSGGVGAAVYAQQNRLGRRKRRARKSASGARTEVVVVACGEGGVSNPLASALYLDLERRGFVVYVVAATGEEENYIRSQNRADLLPLHLDLRDDGKAEGQVRRFGELLGREHWAFEGAEGHRLRFRGVVVVPDLNGGSSAVGGGGGGERIEDLSLREWSTALNAKVVGTIATTKLFLPAVTEYGAKVCLLTPSVMAELRMPGHGLESTMYGALEAFFTTLRAEMRDEHPDVAVHHLKLGDIDIPALTARNLRTGLPAPRLKGTSQRVLHNAVFDALTSESQRGWTGRGGGGGTWYIGRGSWVYGVVGRWVPGGLVGWMVGGAGRRSERGGGVGEEKVLAIEDSMMEGSRGSLPGWEEVGREG